MVFAITNGDVGKLFLIQISFASALSVALIIPKILEPTYGIFNSSKIAASTMLETLNTISISNLNGDLIPSGVNNYYNSSIVLDINIEFNITDTDSLNKLIARDAQLYTVRYTNLGTGENGTILHNFAFNSPTSTYIGTIITSGLPVGNYLISVK